MCAWGAGGSSADVGDFWFTVLLLLLQARWKRTRTVTRGPEIRIGRSLAVRSWLGSDDFIPAFTLARALRLDHGPRSVSTTPSALRVVRLFWVLSSRCHPGCYRYHLVP